MSGRLTRRMVPTNSASASTSRSWRRRSPALMVPYRNGLRLTQLAGWCWVGGRIQLPGAAPRLRPNCGRRVNGPDLGVSWAAQAWAVKQDPGSGVRKAVLMALAYCANHETEQCNPKLETLCTMTCFSRSAVGIALDTLVAEGYISRRREPGKLYEYSFPALDAGGVAETPVVGREEHQGGVAGTPQEPEENLRTPNDVESVTQDALFVSEVSTSFPPAISNGNGKNLTVDRRPATAGELTSAEALLEMWNELAGQDLRSDDWLRKFIMRIREYPDATLEEHRLIMQVNLEKPWWRGPANPSVIYGSGSQFERSIQQVREELGAASEMVEALEALARVERRT